LYLNSTFLIDLLSTIPWDLLSFVIDVGSNVKLMRLLKLMKMAKLVRIYKSSKMFKKMKSKFHLKSSEYNLLKYATVFIMALHWTACAWGIFPQLDSSAAEVYITRRRLKAGGSGTSIHDGRNWIDRMSDKMGHELTAADKYALSIDYALSCMCMGYGTVDARTVTEVWFSILCMMVAGAVYAYVIGGICEALSNEDPASKQFREALDMLNGFFRKQSVPHEIRAQCHTYMDVYRRKIDEAVYNQVFSLFTPQLQQKLAVSMMTQMVRDAQVLRWAHSSEEAFFKKELALHFECAVYPMQENIFKQHDVSDAMYVVCKGLVRCASDSSSCSVSLFAQGHCFGWEMIRNVAFAGNKYKRINSADSFTVVLLQKLQTVKLREALEKKELRKTRKRVYRASHWCLVRECVVSLGKSVLVVKAAAGLPALTPGDKRKAKAFYKEVAKAEAKEKEERQKGLAKLTVVPTIDIDDEKDHLEATADHLAKLTNFGGDFLSSFQARHPTASLDNLPAFVAKSSMMGGMVLADVVAAARLAKMKNAIAGKAKRGGLERLSFGRPRAKMSARLEEVNSPTPGGNSPASGGRPSPTTVRPESASNY
jgi:hypothetical protein